MPAFTHTSEACIGDTGFTGRSPSECPKITYTITPFYVFRRSATFVVYQIDWQYTRLKARDHLGEGLTRYPPLPFPVFKTFRVVLKFGVVVR